MACEERQAEMSAEKMGNKNGKGRGCARYNIKKIG
jgi:hypothetical protein